MKPQNAPDAVPSLRAYVGNSTLVLSIMAGRTIRFLERILPAGTAIVRAMPNTPAAIGRGITVAVANGKVSARQRKQASDLLAAIGAVEWASDEATMDAVTAVSGSGPAYVFLLAEAMTKAGIAAGLQAPLAARLARARPWPARASCCIARTSTPPPCGRTSLRLAAPPPPRWKC